MENLEVAGVGLVALNMGIAQGAKKLGLNQKVAGVVAVVCGVVEGVVFLHPQDLKTGLLTGLALGLMSVGLYSTGKNLSEFKE